MMVTEVDEHVGGRWEEVVVSGGACKILLSKKIKIILHATLIYI